MQIIDVFLFSSSGGTRELTGVGGKAGGRMGEARERRAGEVLPRVEWTGGVRWGEWEMLEELGGRKELEGTGTVSISLPSRLLPFSSQSLQDRTTGNGQAVSIITSIVPVLYLYLYLPTSSIFWSRVSPYLLYCYYYIHCLYHDSILYSNYTDRHYSGMCSASMVLP